MTAWQKFRMWLAAAIWPEAAEKIAELEGRLKTTHSRMREMYWEERAKEAAYGKIAALEGLLVELLVESQGKFTSAEVRDIIARAGLDLPVEAEFKAGGAG